MCARVKQVAELREIRLEFGIPDSAPAINMPARWNGPPSEDFAVVRRNPKTGARALDMLRWGLVPWWSKEARLRYATFTGLTSQVVAIVENVAAHSDVLEEPFDVPDDRVARPAQVLRRVRRTQRSDFCDIEAERDVAGEWIVRRRLVGDEVEDFTLL